MTIPIGTRITVHGSHWLVPNFSGAVIAHNGPGAAKCNVVRLDVPYLDVPPSENPDTCRLLHFEDRELQVIR